MLNGIHSPFLTCGAAALQKKRGSELLRMNVCVALRVSTVLLVTSGLPGAPGAIMAESRWQCIGLVYVYVRLVLSTAVSFTANVSAPVGVALV